MTYKEFACAIECCLLFQMCMCVCVWNAGPRAAGDVAHGAGQVSATPVAATPGAGISVGRGAALLSAQNTQVGGGVRQPSITPSQSPPTAAVQRDSGPE